MRPLFMLLLTILLGFSVTSFAGNPGNSSEGGNVTSIVVCEADESEEDLAVEVARVAISADECSCEIVNPPADDTLDCENTGEDESPCTLCLATLQRAGLSIISVNSYEQFPTDEDEEITLHHYNLVGNAGPFIERVGGCPCPPD